MRRHYSWPVRFLLLALATAVLLIVLGEFAIAGLTPAQRAASGATTGHDSLQSSVIALLVISVVTAAGHLWAAHLRYWFVAGYALTLALFVAVVRAQHWGVVASAAGAAAMTILVAPWLTFVVRICLFFLPGLFQPTSGPRAELRESRARRAMDERHWTV